MKISGAERAAAAALPVPGRASRSKKTSAPQRRGSTHGDARPRSTRHTWRGANRDPRRGNDRSASTSSRCSAAAVPPGRAPRTRKRRRGSRATSRRARSPSPHRARAHISANRRGGRRPNRRPRSWSFPAIRWSRSRVRISRRLSWEGATAAGWRGAEATSWIPLLRGGGAGGGLVWEVGKRRCFFSVSVNCFFFHGWSRLSGLKMWIQTFPFFVMQETNN